MPPARLPACPGRSGEQRCGLGGMDCCCYSGVGWRRQNEPVGMFLNRGGGRREGAWGRGVSRVATRRRDVAQRERERRSGLAMPPWRVGVSLPGKRFLAGCRKPALERGKMP